MPSEEINPEISQVIWAIQAIRVGSVASIWGKEKHQLGTKSARGVRRTIELKYVAARELS